MKKILHTILILLSLQLISGCKPSLSAEDLAKAQGMEWWEVDLPTLPSNAMVRLAFEYEDGTTVPFGGLGVGRPEKRTNSGKARIFIWDYTNPQLRYAIFWNDCSARGTRQNKFQGSAGSISSGESIQLGDPLIAGFISSTNETGEVRLEQLKLIVQTSVYEKPKSEQIK